NTYFPCLYHLLICQPPSSTLFPYTTLFRSYCLTVQAVYRTFGYGSLTVRYQSISFVLPISRLQFLCVQFALLVGICSQVHRAMRSEEHTSELQSRENLVCRLLLEKKNNTAT